MNKYKCSICGKIIFGGYGNNAYPINDGICCNECDVKEVIPARIMEILNRNKGERDDK